MTTTCTSFLFRAGLPTRLCALLMLAFGPGGSSAQTINFAQLPLYVSTSVKPNLLVIYDNSESMDGTMAGRLIAGNDVTTRGNVARDVLRNTITTYRNTFQWGLGSFELVGVPALYTTYAYYFGSDLEVRYTNDCVAGISASNGGLRCVANPEPGNGQAFLTYSRAGDDADINDVLYSGNFGPALYGIGIPGSTSYNVWRNHLAGAGTDWVAGSFNNIIGRMDFTPTDAGFLPGTPPHSRMFWIRRAWGYGNAITGKGVINEPVAADSTAHYNTLMGLLANETATPTSAELKNASFFTPLAGTMGTVASYFSNTLAGQTTPISQTCQRNFVVLATDGNPTGKTDGNMYTLAEQNTTFNAGTGAWTFSTAANDVFSRITGLRSLAITNKTGVNGTYDVQTYVIGLGDSVANLASIATLNQMASLGGTGQAYLASDAASLTSAFARISNDIIARSGASSSVALNAGSWAADTDTYQAKFNPDNWTGQLLAYRLDSTGLPQSTPRWDAGERLGLKNWNTGRQILTYKSSASLGSRGVAFRWPANASTPTATELSPAMVTALNTSPGGTADTNGSLRLNYLRGDTSREVRNCTACTAPTFRNRSVSVLGDIVNSAPVYVKSGGRYVRDGAEAAVYSTYRASRAAMPAMVYVGANDGMLHAFNADTGDETFAYVPSMVADRLSKLTDPSYAHQYTVDGSPAAGDVYYGGGWHTVLVSGLAAGAKGLFGLDVSNTAWFTEANANKVARWEISGSDADVGHVFSPPVLAKMKNGRWMAITGNGYNSTNGVAVLLLIDVETGAITRVSTKAGAATASGSNGLSGVVAVSSTNNGVADVVYAGDLAGNLWRFDLSSSETDEWKVAYGSSSNPKPLFTTASGQPITSRPDVTPHPEGGYLVTMGTGRYLDQSDNAAGSAQALYGIWDKGSDVKMNDLVVQSVLGTINPGSATYRITSYVVGKPATVYTGDNSITRTSYLSGKRGWVLNLPTSGERVVTQAAVRYGKVVVSSMIPSSLPCSAGGNGWIMEVDAVTGNRPDTPSFDTNGDNKVDASDLLTYQTGSAFPSGVTVDGIPTAPTFLRAKDRSLDDKLINLSTGVLTKVREAGNPQRSGRAGWEQIQ